MATLSLSGLPLGTSITLTASNLSVSQMKHQGQKINGSQVIWEGAQAPGGFAGDPVHSFMGYEKRRGGIIVPKHAMVFDVLSTDEEDVITRLGKLRVSTQWEYAGVMLPTGILLATADIAALRHRLGTITSGTPDYVFHEALAGLQNLY